MIHLEKTAQVWCISGNLGGGKTLSAVALAVDSMTRGYYVCSNVTLNIDLIRRVWGDRVASLYRHIDLDDPTFDPSTLPCGSPRGSGGGKRVLVIIDECAEWFDQYTNSKDPRVARLWSWLRHVSKRSQDVLLIVQRIEYLNKSIRILVSRWLVIDDLAVWRMPVLKMRVPFCGGFVMQRVFDRTGSLIYKPTYLAKSTWGKYYDTAECLSATMAHSYVEYDSPVHEIRFPIRSFALFLFSLVLLAAVACMP